MMRLLVTRPTDDGERTARALEQLGHDTVLSPALQVRYHIDVPLPALTVQAILVTSANAVAALQRHRRARLLKALPVLAVGDRTAVAARRAGFRSALSAGGNADDLEALVRGQCAPEGGPLLYAAGADQASDLGARLSDAGYDVETAIVYRTEPTEGLSAEAAAGLRDGTIDGVLLYSARSAAVFGDQLSGEDLSPLPATFTCFCLSEAIGRIAHGYTGGPVEIAPAPNQLELFALIERTVESGSSNQSFN